MSIESLLEKLERREPVPPVPPPKKGVVPLKPTAGASVPLVPPVPPQKIKTKVNSEKTAEIWVICRTEAGGLFRVKAHSPEHAASLQRAGLTVEAPGVAVKTLRHWDYQRGCWTNE